MEVSIRAHDKAADVAMDPVAIHAVLSQLVDNSSRATGADRFTVNARLDEATNIVRLSVTDNGNGMSEEIADQAAIPLKSFWEPKRAGLGLSLVAQVVDNLKGRMDIQSSEDIGTAITLYLPVSGLTDSEPEENQQTGVLIVDDNPQINQVLEFMLESLGYRAWCASSTGEALQTLTDESIDFVLVDLNLGPGSDGISFANQVRQTHPALRIAIMSGDSNELRELAAQYEILNKPFSINDLKQLVTTHKN